MRSRVLLATLTVILLIGTPFQAHSSTLGAFLGFFGFSTFYCSDDIFGSVITSFTQSIPIGDLYYNGISDCSTLGIDHIFSGFICQFEHLMNNVFGQFYCGMQFALEGPLNAFLIFFVTFLGLGFLTSHLQFTGKELTMILAKVALLYTFATQSDVMVQVVFNGFMAFMQATTYVVMHALQPWGTDSLDYRNNGLFGQMDTLLNTFVKDSINTSMVHDPTDTTGKRMIPSFTGSCQNDPIKIVLALMLSMPPIFLILLMTIVKLVWVLLKTILTYLLSITGVMFMLTLAPIFMSLGLFQVTRGFFSAWLSITIGFSAQLFVLFAFLSVTLLLIKDTGFYDYKALVIPWEERYAHDSIVGGSVNRAQFGEGGFCTLCAPDPDSMQLSFTGPKKTPTCAQPVRAIPPTALYTDKGIITLFGIKIMLMAIVAYLLQAILEIAPSIATGLSRGGLGLMRGESPSVFGGGLGSVSPIPGKGHAQGISQAMKSMMTGR